VRFALDSNVLIYAEGLTEDLRNAMAQDILSWFDSGQFVVPLQAIAETTNWLIRKGNLSRREAAAHAAEWIAAYPVQDTSRGVLESAIKILETHYFQTFDAIILAAAAEAGAEYLLSEDMQEGFTWEGVTLLNPFNPESHKLIATLAHL
jgi:predicted nucleic acid-binding protein